MPDKDWEARQRQSPARFPVLKCVNADHSGGEVGDGSSSRSDWCDQHHRDPAGAEDTRGTFALLDYELSPGAPGCPHIATRMKTKRHMCSKASCWFALATASVCSVPGDFAYLPRQVIHAQRNPGPEPARFLMLLVPAGFERGIRELDALMEDNPACSPNAIARCWHSMVYESARTRRPRAACLPRRTALHRASRQAAALRPATTLGLPDRDRHSMQRRCAF